MNLQPNPRDIVPIPMHPGPIPMTNVPISIPIVSKYT